ncbi:hypothetical protein FHX82_005914 [Amycolatopsis bartoniae]|uniref:Uncharacterized protein n=1 Tax=Amycolatopsis bartoniae TaxID=941986 RepID=A0A8H9MFQ5_9PSEU|nr:hypothetical protein [Amycolatopsis bartoniae]MBB2938836.1 hypothetical protein [Amycolatopsis bartoniae]GHF89292.1 hypothetical protein GCM10017566_73720 [Amycolatopsis bartoniae]
MSKTHKKKQGRQPSWLRYTGPVSQLLIALAKAAIIVWRGVHNC